MANNEWEVISEAEALGAGEWESITEEEALRPQPRGLVPEFGAAIGRGFIDVGKGLLGTAQTFSPLFGKVSPLYAAGVTKPAEVVGEMMGRMGEAREEIAPTRGGATGWAVNVIGQTIPYMASAMVGGYAAGLPGAGLVGFAAEGQAAYDEAKAKGSSEFEAQTDRMIVGSVNAAIEALQIGRLMKFQKVGKGSLKGIISAAKNKAWAEMRKQGVGFGAEILKTAVEEALEEAAQEVVSISVPGLARGEWPRRPDGSIDTDAIAQRVGGAALGGAVAGGVLGGGGAAIGMGVEAAAPSRARIESAAAAIQRSGWSDYEKARVLQGLEELLPIEERVKPVEPAAEAKPAEVQPAKEMIPVYRGVSKEGLKGFRETEGVLGKGVYFYDNPLDARAYAGPGGGIITGYIPESVIERQGKVILAKDMRTFEKRGIVNVEDTLTPEQTIETSQRALAQSAAPAKEVPGIVQQEQPAVPTEPGMFTVSESAKRRMGTAKKFETVLVDLEAKRPELRKTTKENIGEKLEKMREMFEDPDISGEDPFMASHIAKSFVEGFAREQIPELTEQISRDEIVDLFQAVREAKTLSRGDLASLMTFFEAIKAGVQPHRSHIKIFDKFFGTNIAKRTPKQKKKGVSKILSIAAEPFNLLKAIVCSGDFSAGGIQALMVLPNDPVLWTKAVSKGYRAFFSPEYVNLTEIEMQTHPRFWMIGEFAPGLITEVGNKTKGEEYFVSELAHRIPWIGRLVRASDRAFVTTLNYLRCNLFYKYMEQHPAASNAEIREILDHIGNITGRGRGKKGGLFEKYRPELGAALWSPGLYAATFKTFTDPFTKSHIRKIAAGDLVQATGFLLVILGLASLDPDNEVELNPWSSDFGKIKRGNTRISFFGRHTQMIRTVAQLIGNVKSGKQKAISTGRVFSRSRLDIASRFIRSKLSPAAAIPWDIISGKTFLGEKMRLGEPEFTGKYAIEKITPMFLQDVVDAIRYQGWGTTLWTSPLGIHGIGMQTYEIHAGGEATRLKDHYAHQYFGADWDEIGPMAQKALRASQPMIDIYEDRAARERSKYAHEDWAQAEQQEAARKVTRGLDKEIQKELARLEVNFGGLSRRISSQWFLNQQRYEQYQRDTQELVNQVAGPLVKSPGWQGIDPLAQRAMLEQIISECKKAARQRIIGEANIADVERL